MKLYLALLGTAFIIISCRKEEPAPDPAPVLTTTGTTAVTYNGTFIAEKYNYWWGGVNTGSLYQVKVSLTATPQTELALLYSGGNYGVVKSNDIELQYARPIKLYIDSTGKLSYSAQVSFQHTSTAIGAINYVSPDTFAVYSPSLAVQIDDTLDKSKNFVIPLNGLTGYTSVTCNFYQQGNLLSNFSKNADAGASSVTFSPAELRGLPSGQFYTVAVLLRRINDQTIGGKLFRFANISYNDFAVYIK
jgi:hypothetical protein